MLTKTNTRLQAIARDIRGMEDRRAELAADIKALYEEAKSEGYTVSALRKAIKIHAMDADKRQKHDAEQLDLELYLAQIEGREVDLSVDGEAAE